jgi:hypothetical protein
MFKGDGTNLIAKKSELPLANLNLEDYYRKALTKISQEFSGREGYSKDKLPDCLEKDCCIKGMPCRYMIRGDKFRILLGEFWDRFWFSVKQKPSLSDMANFSDISKK